MPFHDERLTPEEVVRKKRRVLNPDQSVSTERTITLQTDRGFVNVPSLYQGTQLNPNEALVFAQRGLTQASPFFPTLQEAERDAMERSNAIGIELQREQKRRTIRRLFGLP